MYSYVANRPTNKVDADGHCGGVCIVIGIVATVYLIYDGWNSVEEKGKEEDQKGQEFIACTQDQKCDPEKAKDSWQDSRRATYAEGVYQAATAPTGPTTPSDYVVGKVLDKAREYQERAERELRQKQEEKKAAKSQRAKSAKKAKPTPATAPPQPNPTSAPPPPADSKGQPSLTAPLEDYGKSRVQAQ